MKQKVFALLMALVLLLTACGGENAPAASPAEPAPPAETVPTDEAPDEGAGEDLPGLLSAFSTVDLQGNPVDQSILSGYDLTVVNVWATYCSPCIQEMPDLGELAAEYADDGIQIIGFVSDVLNSDGTVSQSQVELAQDIAEQTGANYTHIVPDNGVLLYILSQISAVPTTFFVDAEGNQVGYAYSGARDKESWMELINAVRAEAGK